MADIKTIKVGSTTYNIVPAKADYATSAGTAKDKTLISGASNTNGSSWLKLRDSNGNYKPFMAGSAEGSSGNTSGTGMTKTVNLPMDFGNTSYRFHVSAQSYYGYGQQNAMENVLVFGWQHSSTVAKIYMGLSSGNISGIEMPGIAIATAYNDSSNIVYN